MRSIDLSGKKGVVFGVANQRSIAWAIAEALAGAGAELSFTYLNERLKESVEKTVSGLGSPLMLQCDATDDQQVAGVYEEIRKRWGQVDLVIHSVAFALHEDLGGSFSRTTRDGFRIALEASAYSLIPVTRFAAPLMAERGGSVVTMTFEASQRVFPGYNIMGTAKAALENEVRQLANEFGPARVRVNAISAGPLATLAARSIPGFNDMRQAFAARAPLRRNITHDEVGGAALFLCSDLSAGVTGAVIPVDAGYSIMGI
ncbi:MAG: enoyl-ACP reductase [Chloroflexi bacterium]|nr:enoyl-ACP reductase [Chloroflexota bacterium]